MGDKSYDSLQNFTSLDCWDYTIELECLQGTQDLQLAAELGKTLLERNKELENTLKQNQIITDDQTQEIEYLTKQTVALREVNDSRLRIYEQLEVSIQDLERANHRLALDNTSDKKQIKNLNSNIETLELKNEELQSTIDELNLEIDALKRKVAKPVESTQYYNIPNARPLEYNEIRPNQDEAKTEEKVKSSPQNEAAKKIIVKEENKALDLEIATEQLTLLMSQLRDNKALCAKEQRRVNELEDQLASMVRQNQTLEKQLTQLALKDDQSKSMQEELSSLDEFRQGQLCCRCLRTIGSSRASDNMSCLDDEPEDDDSSMLNALMNDTPQHRSSFAMEVPDYQKTPTQVPEPNLYRELVEKYEALLEVQRNQSPRNRKPVSNNMSLQEEMSGNFNHTSLKDTDEESGQGDSLQPEKQVKKDRKSFSQTPTDFSEAETSSSGFSDETSNKATQTEGRFGSFLCTIADGDDCKFSIYDDTTAIDSRFRNRPEYRELFSEIFMVLKKAAENKDEGEKLPLLDDHAPVKNTSTPKVPPVTPAKEEIPDLTDHLTDDTQSVLSSTMSEISTNQTEPNTLTENLAKPIQDVSTKKEQILTPYVRQPLEHLSMSVHVRKRSSSRRKKQLVDRSDRPVTPILGSPKITYSSRHSSGRKQKREVKPADPPSVWNGGTLHFYSQKSPSPSPNPNRSYESAMDYKPSTASKDLNKLKRLDLSYAEVLRNADTKKKEQQVINRNRERDTSTRHRKK